MDSKFPLFNLRPIAHLVIAESTDSLRSYWDFIKLIDSEDFNRFTQLGYSTKFMNLGSYCSSYSSKVVNQYSFKVINHSYAIL